MKIEYQHYCCIPEHEILEGILDVHKVIFGTIDGLTEKMQNKPHLLFTVVYAESKVIGYKIGYELTHEKFYSWLGGVHPDYRNLGIASTLMDVQHRYLEKEGYKSVQTKTLNKWRSMLILNIKCGFDITETYIDRHGQLKIVLEKELSKGRKDEESHQL
ncbi:GNAT family N-acetyltransferase [Mesobacillus jeotgali]|uniref:GNAT family N-acetyltransferase n=1 Tax=Mesobacillus jeotgali TaxID=129985 RepID=UPI001F2E8BDF|nr:GNAT family N-acetyltransferase [Mesobacillus jeotgali]